MNIENAKLLRDTINLYGLEFTAGVTSEECGKLIAEINRFFIRKCNSRKDLVEKMADVEIMIDKLKIMIGPELVEQAKNSKMKKIATRYKIDKGEEVPLCKCEKSSITFAVVGEDLYSASGTNVFIIEKKYSYVFFCSDCLGYKDSIDKTMLMDKQLIDNVGGKK